MMDMELCPRCLQRLEASECPACRTHWPAPAEAELGEAIEARNDERSTDWRFFLDLGPGTLVLVSGTGSEALPLALAATGAFVFVAGSQPRALAALQARARSAGFTNVQPVHLPAQEAWPFPSASLDLVAVDPAESPSFDALPGVLSSAARVLKPKGALHVALANRRALPGVFATEASRRGAALAQYSAAFARAGFRETHVMAPLPRYDRSPLFVLPVRRPGALRFFLTRLLPLVHAVSPEVKRRNRLAYALAATGVPGVLQGAAAALFDHLVSGYSVLARKDDDPAAH